MPNLLTAEPSHVTSGCSQRSLSPWVSTPPHDSVPQGGSLRTYLPGVTKRPESVDTRRLSSVGANGHYSSKSLPALSLPLLPGPQLVCTCALAAIP